MELRHLSGFVAVAEEPHFGRAAEILRKQGDALLRLPEEEQEIRIGRYADRLTHAVMATLMDDPDALPRAALDHLAELAEGGQIPVATAKEQAAHV